MTYNEITEKIFNEIKSYFNGALMVNDYGLKKSYENNNVAFDFDKTVNYFKSLGYNFMKLQDAPYPIFLHSYDKGYENFFIVIDPNSKIDPYNINAV